MSRVRVLHPEFGYVGTPSLNRPFMAFVVCGLIAGAISVAIFNPEPDYDRMDAMALAPTEALIAPKPAQPATQSEKRPVTNGPSAQKTRVVRVRPLRAVNERPLIAAVPIGHRDDPTVLPASPPTPIAVSPLLAVPPEEPKAIAAPTDTSIVEATPADAAPATEPTPSAFMPTVTSKKTRPRVHHAQDETRSRRRNQYSDASRYSARSSSYSVSNTYVQGGYARVW